MANPIRHTIDGDWIAKGGLSRNFVNVVTGETISRRQFDKRYGALKIGGFTSYEKKAAASSAEQRMARPARGRGTAQLRLGSNLRNLNPFKGHLQRGVTLPFDVVVTGNVQEFTIQTAQYSDEYESAVANLSRNRKVLALRIVMNGTRAGMNFSKTIIPNTDPESMPSFLELVELLQSQAYVGDNIITLTLWIRFKSSFVGELIRKRPLKTRRRK